MTEPTIVSIESIYGDRRDLTDMADPPTFRVAGAVYRAPSGWSIHDATRGALLDGQGGLPPFVEGTTITVDVRVSESTPFTLFVKRVVSTEVSAPVAPDPFADLILPDATLAELRAIVEDWRRPDPPTRILLIDPPDGTTEALLAAIMAASEPAIHQTIALNVWEVMAEAVAAEDNTIGNVVGRLEDFMEDTAGVGFGLVRIDAPYPIGGDSHPAEVLTRYAIDRVLSGDAALIVATANGTHGWEGEFDVVVYPGAWEGDEMESKVTDAIAALLPENHDVYARRIAEKCGAAPDLRRAQAHIARCVRTGTPVTTKSLAWAMGVML